jgi:hypothetical protein
VAAEKGERLKGFRCFLQLVKHKFACCLGRWISICMNQYTDRFEYGLLPGLLGFGLYQPRTRPGGGGADGVSLIGHYLRQGTEKADKTGVEGGGSVPTIALVHLSPTG